MARFYKKRLQTKGQSPGSLIFVGQQKMEQSALYVMDFTPGELTEKSITSLEELDTYIAKPSITWLNVDGVHDTTLIKAIGERFHIHPMILEDIMNTGQRAKVELIDNNVFIALKMLTFHRDNKEVSSEQLSILISDRFVVTFQEQSGDTFDAVRERIRQGKGRTRQMGAPYLAYSLIDTVVDNYIYLVEHIGEQIEELELQVLESIDKEIPTRINTYKRELNFMAKVMRPAREIPRQLLKLDSAGFDKHMMPFLKDLDDLLVHVLESLDTYRDLTNDYLTIYHTMMSNRMNDVMKVLTIFASIFIPITFFAGVYGMNFDYMPEKHFKWAYPIFWAIVLLAVGAMLWFFKRKKWL